MSLKELDIKRIKFITKLGEKVYFNHRKNMDLSNDLKEILEELCRIDAIIAKENKNYMNKKELTNCPGCLQKLDLDDFFCTNCGFNILDYINKFTVKCENCNSFLKDVTDFCPICGKKI